MGLNGALGEALHVLGQHLLLVAVGRICLGIKSSGRPWTIHLCCPEGLEVAPKAPARPTLAFSKCSTTFWRMGA